MTRDSTARCPSCGRADLDVLVSRERINEELALRRQSFAERIDGYVDEAQQKDAADVARGSTAEILLCRDCDILARREEHSSQFETDHYEALAMERMLRAHIDAYRHKESMVRPLLRPGARAGRATWRLAHRPRNPIRPLTVSAKREAPD